MSRNTCHICDDGKRRYAHWLGYPSANDLADHLSENGMGKENVGANLEWYRTTRDRYHGMVDEGNNRLTPSEAWVEAQKHARANHYTVPDEAAAHDIRLEYWRTHDPFQSDEAIAREALREIRSSLANMGTLPSRERAHSPEEIAEYLREEGA